MTFNDRADLRLGKRACSTALKVISKTKILTYVFLMGYVCLNKGSKISLLNAMTLNLFVAAPLMFHGPRFLIGC